MNCATMEGNYNENGLEQHQRSLSPWPLGEFILILSFFLDTNLCLFHMEVVKFELRDNGRLLRRSRAQTTSVSMDFFL
jgi:hypothetical protein